LSQAERNWVGPFSDPGQRAAYLDELKRVSPAMASMTPEQQFVHWPQVQQALSNIRQMSPLEGQTVDPRWLLRQNYVARGFSSPAGRFFAAPDRILDHRLMRRPGRP
jgi:hypothetical protein